MYGLRAFLLSKTQARVFYYFFYIGLSSQPARIYCSVII